MAKLSLPTLNGLLNMAIAIVIIFLIAKMLPENIKGFFRV